MEKRCLVLRGRVASGKGEGEIYVNLYAREFERILGFRPYPGTLNVKLYPRYVELRVKSLREIRFLLVRPPRGLERLADVRCYPAAIRGMAVYLVEPRIPGYDKRVAELIAPVYLREALGLRDGDEAEILVGECELTLDVR